MIYSLIYKEINDALKNKTALIYFFILFAVIVYSFYSAVDLYSKASVAAINNPLYASGFEPVPGVFVPSFGGLFIVFSIIAPFLFIQSIGNEKKYNTLPMLFQLPFSMPTFFITKFFASVVIVMVSIVAFIPIFILWYFLGGHIPIIESFILMTGYFLYGIFVVSVSYFAASFLSTSYQASIFTLAVIISFWFIDFGKDMNILPFLRDLSDWTLTHRLKEFENGILSLQTIGFFILVISFFSFLSFCFFSINIKYKIKASLIIIISHLLLLLLIINTHLAFDLSESKRNSFSLSVEEFLNKLPAIDIEVFLDPLDSRFKDYEKDFLKKLLMSKRNVSIHFAKGKELEKNYGSFKYRVNDKTATTYSNSYQEIFMLLEDISGIKIKTIKEEFKYKGYPLVVKKQWSLYLFLLYLIVLPLMILFIYFRKKTII